MAMACDADCPTGTVEMDGRCVCGDESACDGGSVTTDSGPADAGVPDSGCVPTSEEDVPDDAFVDADCDGVDGDAASAVFVSPSGDDESDGTREAPVASLTRALAIAVETERSYVFVALGTYPENIELVEGVHVVGGYSDAWARGPEKSVLRAAGTVVRGADISAATTVRDLRIEGSGAAIEESSIAMQLARSSGVQLVSMQLVAGRGGDGEDATAASGPADPGDNGDPGDDASATGSDCSPLTVIPFAPLPGAGGDHTGCGCGAGGSGGFAGGFGLTSPSPPSGGSPGAHGNPTYDAERDISICPDFRGIAGGPPGTAITILGERGRDGVESPSGDPGAGGGVIGSMNADGVYLAADGRPGTDGAPGAGGSGGGGGFGCRWRPQCQVSGGAGGGGGAGGCSGSGGGGGGGGGASFALVLIDSSPLVTQSELVAGDGGRGGDGAAGQTGGTGGRGGFGGFSLPTPGSCGGNSGAGGDGGNGAAGGDGGPGGGGGGGPSVALVFVGDSLLDPASADNVLTAGTAGPGGATAAGGNAGADGFANDVRALE
jgi:hypothetical protein